MIAMDQHSDATKRLDCKARQMTLIGPGLGSKRAKGVRNSMCCLQLGIVDFPG